MKQGSIYQKFFIASLTLGAIALISGLWVMDVLRVLIGINAVLLISKKNRQNAEYALETLAQKSKSYWLLFPILLAVMAVANMCFHYLGLGALMWDEGQFFNLTYNFLHTGIPTTTGRSIADYFLRHKSVSIYLITPIYHLFQSFLVLEVYQSVLAAMPAFIFMWALYYEQKKRNSVNWLQISLVGVLFLTSAQFVGYRHGSYAFHILGPSLMALACVGYYFRNAWLWFLSIAVLCFEKEDFALPALGFSVMIIVSEIFLREKKNKRALVAGAIVLIPLCLWTLAYFSHTDVQESSGLFKSYFGAYGDRPSEAIKNIFLNPQLLIHGLCNLASLKYLGFYFIMSFCWRSFSWQTLRFIIPVLPVLFANALVAQDGVYNFYQKIEMHSSVLINTAFVAAIVFGCAKKSLDSKGLGAALLVLILGIFVGVSGSDDSIADELFANIKGTLQLSSARAYLEQQAESDGVVKEIACCEDFDHCSYVAAHRWIFEAPQCYAEARKKNLPILFVTQSSGKFFDELSAKFPADFKTPQLTVFKNIRPLN